MAGKFVFAGDEVQGDAVIRGDLAEVAAVEGGHLRDSQAFRDRDYGCVGRAEWELAVLEARSAIRA